jgi:hypothetical protein
MSLAEIEARFPNLKAAGYEKRSDATEDYNCFAFAANQTTCRLDPTGGPDCDWPDNILPTLFISSFLELYRSYGFEVCDNGDLEEGHEKIAIYVNEAEHAARQLPSGKWTSKIGDDEDIEHNTLQSLEGYYGKLAKFMKRPIHPKMDNPADAKT